MMNARKILILIKKDIYINYLLFLTFMGAEILYLVVKFDSPESKILLEFIVFLFLTGNSISYFVSYNLFNIEHKEKTLKTLKSLSFTNSDIFFSKLFLGYMSLFIFSIIPGFIIFIYSKIAYPEISIKLWLYIIIGMTFLFLIEVSFFTFFFASFDKLIFIAISQIIIFMSLIMFFKFQDITGTSLIYILNNNLFKIIIEVLFYLSPFILVLLIYSGYKIYDKIISYRKFI